MMRNYILLMILSVLGWWLTAGSAIANVGGRNVFNQREHIIKTTKVGEIIYVSLADIQILINGTRFQEPPRSIPAIES